MIVMITGAPDPYPYPAGYPVVIVDLIQIWIRLDLKMLSLAGIWNQPDPN